MARVYAHARRFAIAHALILHKEEVSGSAAGSYLAPTVPSYNSSEQPPSVLAARARGKTVFRGMSRLGLFVQCMQSGLTTCTSCSPRCVYTCMYVCCRVERCVCKRTCS